jgi:hypothetical protein
VSSALLLVVNDQPAVQTCAGLAVLQCWLYKMQPESCISSAAEAERDSMSAVC